MWVDPTVLSPLSRQVVHEWAPLNPFMLHTAARAGRSTVLVNIIPLHVLMPSGVETSIPIKGNHYFFTKYMYVDYHTIFMKSIQGINDRLKVRVHVRLIIAVPNSTEQYILNRKPA